MELIYLSGGDPFVKRWTDDLIAYIIGNGITPSLSTKEHLSSSRCANLYRVGVRRLQVSIDTLEDATGAHMVGRAKATREALESIANAQKAGITVVTNSVVTKLNLRGLPALVSALVESGIKDIVLSRYGRSLYSHHDDLFVDDADLEWMATQLVAIPKPADLNLSYPRPKPEAEPTHAIESFLGRSACAFGRVSITVTPSGKVIPCEQLPTEAPYVLGDLTTNHLREIWNSDKLRELLYPPRAFFESTSCASCQHFELCIYGRGWCIRENHKLHGPVGGTHPDCPREISKLRLT